MFLWLLLLPPNWPSFCVRTTTLSNDEGLLHLRPASMESRLFLFRWKLVVVEADVGTDKFEAGIVADVFCFARTLVAKQDPRVVARVSIMRDAMRISYVTLMADSRKIKSSHSVHVGGNMAFVSSSTCLCDIALIPNFEARNMLPHCVPVDSELFPSYFSHFTPQSLSARILPKLLVFCGIQVVISRVRLAVAEPIVSVSSEIVYACALVLRDTNNDPSANGHGRERVNPRFRDDGQHESVRNGEYETDEKRKKTTANRFAPRRDDGTWTQFIASDGTDWATSHQALRHAAQSPPKALGASPAVSITHELFPYPTKSGPVYHVFDGATNPVAKTSHYHKASRLPVLRHGDQFLILRRVLARLIALKVGAILYGILLFPRGMTPAAGVFCATTPSAQLSVAPPPRPDTEPYPTGPDEDRK